MDDLYGVAHAAKKVVVSKHPALVVLSERECLPR